MSKAIEGAVMLAGAVGMGVVAFFDPAVLASPWYLKAMAALVMGGISMEAGAIASELTSNRGQNITTRMTAGLRQVVYGMQRIGGTTIYQSTTGAGGSGGNYIYNYIIVLASHPIEAIVNIYLDGRQVYWRQDGRSANVTRNGINFGGMAAADPQLNSPGASINPSSGLPYGYRSGYSIGPDGQHYNFSGKVYCEARFGDQPAGDYMESLSNNDWSWPASANVSGCAYIYLNVGYDTDQFPSAPEIRVTVQGKNDIYDPRTGTAGYSTNWALQVADVIADDTWGLGEGPVSAWPTNALDQLIAAANVCDEQIETSQGLESNYAQHLHYDSSTSPGDALALMMPNAAGRISRVGGGWLIYPAYWQGPSFAFDESALVGTPSWTPNRSAKDLFNRVNGTYIAPNYPYNCVGNLYDANGWYYGTINDVWPFAWQPTNFPQYAADVRHGFAADTFLTEDGGQILPKELTLRGCISIVQAQRVSKVALYRNRQQGTGSFPMQLAAWQMQPMDVMQFSWPLMGWTNKLLEVDILHFVCEEQQGKDEEDGDDGPKPMALSTLISVIETDASVYEWSAAEELTPYDVPAAASQMPYYPAPPTGLTLTSSAATAVQGADGITIPRVLVSWTAPEDITVVSVDVQYRSHGAITWIDSGPVPVALFETYISGVVAGSAYDFRVRSLRSSSSASTWVEVDDYTVSIVLSTVAASTVSGLTAAAVAHLSALTTLAADPVTPGMGAAAQVGAGATVAVTGSAAAGTITLTTGTGTLAAGQICTVTFQSALASTPNGVCAANGSPIPGLSWVATSTVLTLSVSTALAPSTVYEIGYSLS